MILPICIFIIAVLLIPFLKVEWKGIITISAVILNAILGVILSIKVLAGEPIKFILFGTNVTGDIAIRIDALSAWFILVINFTFVTGILYGYQYLKSYKEQSANITLHYVAFLFAQSMLTVICVVQNALVFLFAWEIMALSVALLVIFEHYKHETIKAGMNYIIQSHICIVLLSIGFIWVASKTHTYDFNGITQFTDSHTVLSGVILFLCFFFGFAFKAGFVPFHTWLPYAHPAAPSHISAIMSGVVIKIGIYGILRILLVINSNYLILGFIILIISVISGVYGVMLAIVQHNLKKLLAYHSIENIGIIGIGIGLGTIGIGTNNFLLTTLGFTGGLLHVLNHSLFKSLLFYGAGNVYQATHTVNIESLGGLIKKLPHTSLLFLIAALAICGLPPFNGFVSEFFIYSGLFNGLDYSDMPITLLLLFSVFGLVIIGGLAFLCLTKAFGSVFLGNSRQIIHNQISEANAGKLIPMYIIMFFILIIGIFPSFFLDLLCNPVMLFTNKINTSGKIYNLQITQIIQYIGWCAFSFILLSLLVFLIRKLVTSQKSVTISSTWGCGYTGNTEKMQYTASSFIRTYRKLFEPLLSVHKKKIEIKGIFPVEGLHQTHAADKVEEWFIDAPLNQFKFFLGKFRFIQNGSTQYYVLYGVVFIFLVIAIPMIFDGIKILIEFLNNI